MASTAAKKFEYRSDVLKRMYETGEWSDFSVITETKTFLVHKSVVCPASAYFHAACTAGFQEASAGRIKMEEDEHTIDAILRHFYEQPVEWLSTDWSAIINEESGTRREWLLRIVALRKASDKYGLTALTDDLRAAFYKQYRGTTTLGDIVDIGVRLYDAEMPVDTYMRAHVTRTISSVVEDIEKDAKLWDIVCQNKDFMKCVFSSAMKALQTAKKRAAPAPELGGSSLAMSSSSTATASNKKPRQELVRPATSYPAPPSGSGGFRSFSTRREAPASERYDTRQRAFYEGPVEVTNDELLHEVPSDPIRSASTIRK